MSIYIQYKGYYGLKGLFIDSSQKSQRCLS